VRAVRRGTLGLAIESGTGGRARAPAC